MLQVHGNNVFVVSKKNVGQVINNCDGLVTNDPSIYLKISVADCIPLAIYDPKTQSIGLIHAGWRGLDSKIIKNTILLMKKEFLVNPMTLFAEIGPHICQKHYEIGDELVSAFVDYPKAIKRVNGKAHLNLEEIAKEQLIECGVKNQNIKFDKRCTYEDTSLPSFRRGDYKKRIHYLLKVPESP